ncbi:MAG: hypothetical protein ACE15F_10075 [bacterium]
MILVYRIVRALRQAWAAFELTVEEGLKQLATLCSMEKHVSGQAACRKPPSLCEESLRLLAVLIRKIMYGNRSDQGALPQGVLITVFPHLETMRVQSHRDPCGLPAGIRPHRAPAAFPTS